MSDLVSLKIALVTLSDTRTLSEDKSGDYLATALQEAGHQLAERTLIPDNIYQLRALVSRWIADEAIQVVISTGGTGLTGRDGTPEAVKPLFDKEIEGFGEMFRYLSWEEIGTSTMQSRTVAGMANGTYIFCLPGSTGACRLGWSKLIAPQLDMRNRPCNLVELLPRLRET